MWSLKQRKGVNLGNLYPCKLPLNDKREFKQQRGRENENGNKAIAGLHVTHGGHVGGQEQKHFSPLGTKLYFRVHKLYFHAH